MKKSGIFEEIGYTKSYDYGSRFEREPIRQLRGLDGVKTYREMQLNSPIIASSLFAAKMVIRRAPWSVASDIPNDPRAAFIEEQMNGMSHSWNDHISQALTFLAYGWSWFEVVYKRCRDGRVGWKKFALRAQDTMHPSTPWVFDESGALQGFNQWMTTLATRDYASYATCIPIEKSILYRTQTDDNDPEGRSLLRAAYTSYFYARNLREIEAIGLERDASGLPYLRETGEAGTNLASGGQIRQDAEALLRRIRIDEEAGVLVPHGFEFGLLSGGGQSKNIRQAIESYEHRMAMPLLAGFMLLGTTESGSYSLSTTLSELFYLSLTAWADVIADTLNRHTVPKLLKLNGYSCDGMPEIIHAPIADADAENIAKYFQMLSRFVEPDPELERWLRELVQAPELTDAEIQAREAARPQAAPQQQLEQMALADYYAVTPEDIEDETMDMRKRAEARLEAYYRRQRRDIVARVEGAV